MIKAILFDMDGTLWDATEVMYKSWNAFLKSKEESKEYFIDRESIKGLMGKTMDILARDMLPNLSFEKAMEVCKGCVEAEDKILKESGASLYPHLEETLKSLKENCKLMIVSNGQKGYAKNFARVHKLEYLFDDYETFGNTGRPKDENIKLVLERNGINPKEAVYVGDTIMDEEAARKAGTYFIHAAYGFGKAKNPDGIIKDLLELKDVIGSLKEVEK